MVKKLAVVLILTVLAAGGAFAQAEFKLSAGAGGYITSDFGGGAEALKDGYADYQIFTPYFGGGIFAFMDATFAELSIGFWGGSSIPGSGSFYLEGNNAGYSRSYSSYMGLDIGLLGKYPFVITDKISVFPLLGIGYRLILSLEPKNENDNNTFGAAADSSALWIRLGGGLDYSFTDMIYLRGGLLYGLRFPSKFENDWIDKNVPAALDGRTLLGHGLEIKVAVGFKFNSL